MSSKGESPSPLARLADGYHQQLLTRSDKLAELDQRLGLTLRTVQRFKLGYVAEPLAEHHEPHRNLIVTPYIAADGSIPGLRAGAIEADHKHNYTQGWMEATWPFISEVGHIYNVGRILPTPRRPELHLVEDVHSVLIADQLDLRACALPGFNRVPDHWYELLADNDIHIWTCQRRRWEAAQLVTQLRQRQIIHTVHVFPHNATFGRMHFLPTDRDHFRTTRLTAATIDTTLHELTRRETVQDGDDVW